MNFVEENFAIFVLVLSDNTVVYSNPSGWCVLLLLTGTMWHLIQKMCCVLFAFFFSNLLFLPLEIGCLLMFLFYFFFPKTFYAIFRKFLITVSLSRGFEILAWLFGELRFSIRFNRTTTTFDGSQKGTE